MERVNFGNFNVDKTKNVSRETFLKEKDREQAKNQNEAGREATTDVKASKNAEKNAAEAAEEVETAESAENAAEAAEEVETAESAENAAEAEFGDVVSASECTGLMQGAPIDEEEKENYGKLFDYGAEAGMTGTGMTEAMGSETNAAAADKGKPTGIEGKSAEGVNSERRKEDGCKKRR